MMTRQSVAFDFDKDDRIKRRTSHGSQDALREKLIDYRKLEGARRLSMQVFGCHVMGWQGLQRLVSFSVLNL